MKMNFLNEIEKSKKSYKEEWEYTSQLYYDEGYYDFFAKNIDKDSKVLEIGCGSGFSSIALSKRTKKLIIVDENRYCINSTHENLSKVGVNTSKLLRGKVFADNEKLLYQTKYEPISLSDDVISLIEGDVLNDEPLEVYLKSIGGFDTITCWLIGAHGLILNHKSQRKKGRNALYRTPQMVQDYKFDVLTKTINISINLLNQNGFLLLIERFNLNYLDMFSENEILNIYNEKFEKSGMYQFNGFELHTGKTRSKMAMVSNDKVEEVDEIGFLILKYKIKES